MISLIRSGFFESFDTRAAWIWGFLAVTGLLLCLVLRRRRLRLAVSCGSLGLTCLCDLAAMLPTPSFLAGDGYAIVGDVGLIAVSFLLPLTAGICLSFLLTLLIPWLYRRIRP